MTSKPGSNQPKSGVRRAAILGALLPVLLGPIASVAVMLTFRFYPWYPAGLNLLAEAVVPESGAKGLIVPIVSMIGLPVLPGSALVAAVSWRMLHSGRLALLACAVSFGVQLAGICLLVGALTLMA